MLGNLIMMLLFLSTLSLRRATVSLGFAGLPPLISIHALLAESDYAQQRCDVAVL